MAAGQKLELTWIGKDKEERVEPRILIYDKEKSYGDQNTGNMLIHGDNLLALKSLEQDYAGKIKCIYIDPPYNTGSAFEQYDDNVEHSLWLSMMRVRLNFLNELLSKSGSIWISIDDNEGSYLKILCDEIFGRKNFVANVVWQKRTSPDMRSTLGAGHENILVYAKDKTVFKQTIHKLPKTEEQKKMYKNPDNDPRGAWVSADFTAQGFRPNQMYKIVTPGGTIYEKPPVGKCWKNIEPVYLESVKEGRIWFGKNGKGIPRRKTYLSESEGQNVWTWWTNKEVGHNQEAKKEIIKLFGASNAFDTPKPERLIERIIQLSTDENDIVLDSFLGSGTTAAVAHKMNRRYIGIELGEHCLTHCKLRLDKVVDGEQGGISKNVNWQGGGGYHFYELASSLLKKDEHNQWIFDYDAYEPEQRETMIAEAIAKLNGYHYTPNDDVFWKQGMSHPGSYIYTTTQYISATYLDEISKSMNEDERLLVCCPAFDNGLGDRYDNIVVKKIPQTILDKCEFGREDYKINIIETPDINEEEDEVDDDE